MTMPNHCSNLFLVDFRRARDKEIWVWAQMAPFAIVGPDGQPR
jgi:hypothetical protein